MDIKIIKFNIGDYYAINYLQETNKDGEFTHVLRGDKYSSIPHEDLTYCIDKILEFYNAVISKDYTENVLTSHIDLSKYLNRVLAKRILRTWNEDFIDEDTGETVSIERNEIVFDQGEVITRENVEEIKQSSSNELFLYKENFIPSENLNRLFTGFKAIELFYHKDNSELKSFRLELYLRDKCPLMHENKCTTKTSKIFLDRTYKTVFHVEIQQKFIELINKLNLELLEYMKGKNGLPEQTKLFD